MCHALGTEGNTTLTALGLARNNVGDAGLDAISGVLSGGGPGGEQNTTLRALAMPFCGLSDDRCVSKCESATMRYRIWPLSDTLREKFALYLHSS